MRPISGPVAIRYRVDKTVPTLAAVAVALFLLSCAAPTTRNDLNSTLWVRTAAEYRALAEQAYADAAGSLDAALKDTAWTAALEQSGPYEDLPPAVILDIDETVLDNSRYQAELVRENARFDPETWDRWVASAGAGPISGVVEFAGKATARGITLIFITNRECAKRKGFSDPCPQEGDTIQNLENIGILDIEPGQVLLRGERPGWGSEKESRRKSVAESYRILMLFGDDLGDFLPNVRKNITPKERIELVHAYKEMWGKKWFVLPNPVYGSWYRVLKDPKEQYLK